MLGKLNNFPLVKCKKDDFILKVKCGKWLNGQDITNHTSLVKKKLKNKTIMERRKTVIQSTCGYHFALNA